MRHLVEVEGRKVTSKLSAQGPSPRLSEWERHTFGKPFVLHLMYSMDEYTTGYHQKVREAAILT